MFTDFLHDDEFAQLMQYHIADIIDILLKKGQYFSILTNIEHIQFEPELPQEILSSFGSITLFIISEYTFDTCSIDKDYLYFEAGFGSENIGSFVKIPLISVVQIILNETPIFINLSVSQPKKETKSINIENSTNIFLSDPQNKDIVKKTSK